MNRKWVWALIPFLLLGWWIWFNHQVRLTPEAAARSVPFVRGDVIQTARFDGGAAVLLADHAMYYAVSACRWGLVLWHPCGGTNLAKSERHQSIVASASTHADGGDGWAISIFAGRAAAERITHVAYGDQQQPVGADGQFLFAERVAIDAPFPRAVALSATGQELYEWSRATLFQWKQLQPVSGN